MPFADGLGGKLKPHDLFVIEMQLPPRVLVGDVDHDMRMQDPARVVVVIDDRELMASAIVSEIGGSPLLRISAHGRKRAIVVDARREDEVVIAPALPLLRLAIMTVLGSRDIHLSRPVARAQIIADVNGKAARLLPEIIAKVSRLAVRKLNLASLVLIPLALIHRDFLTLALYEIGLNIGDLRRSGGRRLQHGHTTTALRHASAKSLENLHRLLLGFIREADKFTGPLDFVLDHPSQIIRLPFLEACL